MPFLIYILNVSNWEYRYHPYSLKAYIDAQVCIFSITGVDTTLVLTTFVREQMLDNLFVRTIDALVLIAPERVQCHALVGLGAITPQRRTTIEFGQGILQVRNVATDIVVNLTYTVGAGAGLRAADARRPVLRHLRLRHLCGTAAVAVCYDIQPA